MSGLWRLWLHRWIEAVRDVRRVSEDSEDCQCPACTGDGNKSIGGLIVYVVSGISYYSVHAIGGGMLLGLCAASAVVTYRWLLS